MVLEAPKMIVLWKFRNYVQTQAEFGRLAESFALHFSGRAAARLDEPPLIIIKRLKTTGLYN